MKPETVRRSAAGAAVLLLAAGLIALTWVWTLDSVQQQRRTARAHAAAVAESLATGLAEQVDGQLEELDDTLRVLARAWKADPTRFTLRSWRDVLRPLDRTTLDILLIDDGGRVIQALHPDSVGEDVSWYGWFRSALKKTDPTGLTALGDPVKAASGHWFVPLARRLQAADGADGAVLAVEYRLDTVQALLARTQTGAHGLAALVGLDGSLLAAVGAKINKVGDSLADTVMYSALQATPDGSWSGPSPDETERLHAFRQIPSQDLVAVVALARKDTLASAAVARSHAMLAASAMTALILLGAGLILGGTSYAARQRKALSREHTLLRSAGAQLERAREQVDTRAAQLQATLAGMSDGVALIDSRLQLLDWNHRFPEIAGVPASLLRVGLPLEEVLRAQAAAGRFGDGDAEAAVARRLAALRGGNPAGGVMRDQPDGQSMELRSDRLPDGSFILLYQDVTTRRRAETALREARAMAEAAAEAKSRFVAIVSHEIRSPLGALLDTLRLLDGTMLQPSQQVLLRTAHQSGDALLGLINDILDMSGMEAGQLTLRPGTLALAPLLAAVPEMFQALAAERGITLRLDAAPDLPATVYADAGRLRQVLVNLLSNAMKFGLPGEVVLLARLEEDAVNRQALRLSVRDRGPVIEAEGRARLFRPFSRLSVTGEAPEGSGLGLAICRYLVTLMGGEIGCDPWMDREGKAGNEFWVRLPLASVPDGAQPGTAATDDLPRLPRSRVLLVEDSPAERLITATLLRREGHLVDIAENGAAALTALSRHPYDLAFLDLYMPGQGGLEVVRQIRALPGPAGAMPIIALIANATDGDRDACEHAGMTGLVGKPAAVADLLAALGRHAWRGMPLRRLALHAPRLLPAAPVLAMHRVEELRNLLPADALSTMVEECLADLQARLPVLRRALQNGAAEQAAAQAHAMLGIAAGYGMPALEARLRALMQAVRSGNSTAAAVLADQAETALAHGADALRETLLIELV